MAGIEGNIKMVRKIRSTFRNRGRPPHQAMQDAQRTRDAKLKSLHAAAFVAFMSRVHSAGRGK
jgi:hypothetical protein